MRRLFLLLSLAPILSCNIADRLAAPPAISPASEQSALASQEVNESFLLSPRFGQTEPTTLVDRFRIDGTHFDLRVRQAFNRRSGIYELGIEIHNRSTVDAWRPIDIVCLNLLPRSVSFTNADNGWERAGALWGYAQFVGLDGRLSPNETGDERVIRLRTPVSNDQTLRSIRISVQIRTRGLPTFIPSLSREPTVDEAAAGIGIGVATLIYRSGVQSSESLAVLNAKLGLVAQDYDSTSASYIAFTSDTTPDQTRSTVARISSHPLVQAAEIVPIMQLNAVPPGSEVNLWQRLANFPAYWSNEEAVGRIPGQGIVIGFIDSGIDQYHPEFSGRIKTATDVRSGGALYDPQDHHGHGTLVAGVIAANSNGKMTAGGAYGATLVSIKDETHNGAWPWNFRRALRYVLSDASIDILNISQGVLTDIDPLDYLESIISRGTVVVAGAGNYCKLPGILWPAREPDVIAVSATDNTGSNLAPYSCSGSDIDISALGEVATTFFPNPSFCIGNPQNPCFAAGTSFAAPQVAAAAALLSARDPSLRGSTLRAAVLQQVVDVGPPGIDALFGAGRLFLTASPSGPQTGTVAGVVSSPQRGPLVGVTVTAAPSSATGVTTASGSYSLATVAIGQATLSLSNLPSGCTNPGSQTVTVPANASVQATFTVTCGLALPDIIVTHFCGPVVWPLGVRTNASITLRNVGSAPAPAGPAWIGEFYLSTDQALDSLDYRLGGFSTQPALAPGQSHSASDGGVPTLAAGTYYLILVIDPLQQLVESDETNNTFLYCSVTTVTP